MEQADLGLIERYQEQDSELRALWEQHQEYERILQKYEGRPYLSPTQMQEIKQLKKKKLAGKTKLQQVLQQYREAEE
ncbi:hypothetical protein SAMN02745704_01354 [Paucidesulfovibrio gracilis DSM 16080]|uniref:DUF465 domain-containing protein n=1 Tax=Paucidesulfovibrio gracilis DSM 16080 TaxID=1121449 RepID=A0A1T4WTL2_9BACT|nr:DUF465 domain-containing protein [Paucidesulfovibrio gracilis]SKA80447.1 hypothetical protein SAMN02745704_01354 [Paucidesulfovibrio gracilis DSM 16080]